MKEWTTEQEASSLISQQFPMEPDCAIKNSQRYTSSNTVQPPLPSLDLPDSGNREESSQIAEPLCTDCATLGSIPDAQNAQCTPYAQGTHKSTRENLGKPAKSFSDFYL